MRFFLLIAIVLLIYTTPSPAAPSKVIFDQAHAQAFTIDKAGELQLGRLADFFRSDGWQVEAMTAPFSADSLAGADALIISGAFKPLSDTELAAVGQFLHRGGRLAVMLHIAQPLVPLLGKLGVASANGVVREGNKALILGEEPLNFKVTDLYDHPLNRDLTHFNLYGGWPLMPLQENARIIASTSPSAWVDLNRDKVLSPKDAMQVFGVLLSGTVGQGEFVVFADDAIFQNRFLKGENEKLARNLSRWLLQGRVQTGLEI